MEFRNTQNNSDETDHAIENHDLESKDTSLKGLPQACLFVANISEDTNETMLREIFGGYGKLLSVKLLRDRSSRPYAFVQFSIVEEADLALEETKGVTLNNVTLRVEKAKVNRTLFLAKLSKQLLSTELREIAEEFGEVESVTIIKNHQTNQSKGCGFVKFIYREDAMEAFVGLKNKWRKWVVEWATSTNDPDLLGVDKLNIFIGGLNPYRITKEVLEDKFKVYGEIESLTLVNKAAGDASEDSESLTDDQSSGESLDGSGPHQRSAFAFVRYKDKNHSASAIEGENGAEWLDRRVRVQYCESQEMKNKRRANKFFQSMQYSAPPGFYSTNMQIPSGPMIYSLPPPLSYLSPTVPKYLSPSGANGSFGNAFSYPMIYNGAPGAWMYPPPMYSVDVNGALVPSEVEQYSPPTDFNNPIPHFLMDDLSLN